MHFARKALASSSHTGVDQLSDGDRVVQRFELNGTHTGEITGIPPSGNRFEVRGIKILRFSDGVIAEIWAMFDTLSMMQQIGAVPAPETAAD
ncbi:MAG: ester cyclase [Chloroflexota bacterium]